MFMLLRMRTTIEFDDNLLVEAKKRAAEERRPLRALMEEALRRHLSEPGPRDTSAPIRFVTSPTRLPSDVDLASREALPAWLEGQPRYE